MAVDSGSDHLATPSESEPKQPDPTRVSLSLLAEEIPLTLIIDLASAVDSRDVYAHEGGTADWLYEGR